MNTGVESADGLEHGKARHIRYNSRSAPVIYNKSLLILTDEIGLKPNKGKKFPHY